MLTSSDSEKETAERFLGYKFERVLGFCTKEPGCGAYLPLYRFYNAIAKGNRAVSLHVKLLSRLFTHGKTGWLEGERRFYQNRIVSTGQGTAFVFKIRNEQMKWSR